MGLGGLGWTGAYWDRLGWTGVDWGGLGWTGVDLGGPVFYFDITL